MPVTDIQGLINNRVSAIRDYHEKVGFDRAQLDVSGGVDSAVMLGLLAKALGPSNITAVYTNINSSHASCERAREGAETFGVRLHELDLTQHFEEIVKAACASLPPLFVATSIQDPTVLGSFRSCLRAPVGRLFNRLSCGGIRHGTGNECEDKWLRFYQKGGDGEVDTNPLAMLTKGEVYQLAVGLGIPDSILTAKPSPDLQGVGDSHNDEDELENLYGVKWTYSTIHTSGAHKGKYKTVGTIERMSRLFDCCEFEYGSPVFEARFEADDLLYLSDEFFPCYLFDPSEVFAYCESALCIERATRHKMNPNCPSLGDRETLRIKGILTDYDLEGACK